MLNAWRNTIPVTQHISSTPRCNCSARLIHTSSTGLDYDVPTIVSQPCKRHNYTHALFHAGERDARYEMCARLGTYCSTLECHTWDITSMAIRNLHLNMLQPARLTRNMATVHENPVSRTNVIHAHHTCSCVTCTITWPGKTANPRNPMYTADDRNTLNQ